MMIQEFRNYINDQQLESKQAIFDVNKKDAAALAKKIKASEAFKSLQQRLKLTGYEIIIRKKNIKITLCKTQ